MELLPTFTTVDRDDLTQLLQEVAILRLEVLTLQRKLEQLIAPTIHLVASPLPTPWTPDPPWTVT